MAILKGSAIGRLMRSPPPETKAVLVYGPDAGRVSEVASAIVRSLTGALDDPFLVAKLSDDRLLSDPGLLADEARALSFTGGRRVVWITAAGRGFQEAAAAYLEEPGGDALIVAEAGVLPKSSRLRGLFENAREAAAIACYEDSEEDLRSLVSDAAREAGLAIAEDVVDLVVARIGSDRALSRRELEKLLLYCHGNRSIDAADVEAVCGDVSASSLDALVDAVFEGDMGASCRQLMQLAESGTSASAALSSIGGHAGRLLEMRTEIERGKSREALVRGARPPILFRRQAQVLRQLSIWPPDALDEAIRTVLEATRQTRQFPNLDFSITERAVLTLARRSRSLRSHAA